MKVIGRVWTEVEKYKDKNNKEHVAVVLIDEDGQGRSSAQFFRVEVPDAEKYKRGQLLAFWGVVSYANAGNVRFRPEGAVEVLKEGKPL